MFDKPRGDGVDFVAQDVEDLLRLFPLLGGEVVVAGKKIGDHDARRNRADLNRGVGRVLAQALLHVPHGTFGRPVSHHPGLRGAVGTKPLGTPDLSTALCEHVANRDLRPKYRAGEVRGDQTLERLVALFPQRLSFDAYAGIVDPDVGPAERFCRAIPEPLQRGRIGDIAGDATYLRFAIILSEFGDGRRYGVGRSTADRHRASTFQELAGEPVADASRRSGDYNPLAHLSPFSGAPIERSSSR